MSTSSTPSATDALVDDILIETFTFLAEPSRRSFRNVLTASHVCSRWRKLALASPELWRRFAFLTRDGMETFEVEDKTFTSEILGRCWGVTLDVGWEHIYSRPVGMVRWELGMGERLRMYRLPLVVGDENWWGMVTAPLSRVLPTALEELSLLDVGLQTETRHLPLDKMKWLFGQDLCIPALRKLHLKDIRVDVHLLSLPNLEELNWEVNPTPQSGGVGVSVPPCIFETLGVHTGIRRLRIHQRHVVETTNLSGELELPHLSELDLATDFSCLSLLLSHLSLPRCRTVRIKLLRNQHPRDEFELSDKEMVMTVTERIVERMVAPLVLQQQQQQQESSGNTLSFLRCEDTRVEYVFSPCLHDTPHWARDPHPDDLTIVIGFPHAARPWKGTTIRGVLGGWTSGSADAVKVACLDLPDDPLVAEEYGEHFDDFVRYPTTSVERLICSLDWARVFVDGVVTPTGEGRFRAADPPLEIIIERSAFPVSMSIR